MLRDSFKEPEPPDLILISTGTEVHICARAADLLEADGIATRVVSMPCMENFADQDDDYREQRAAAGVRARVSVEAAATFGWHRWVGEHGEADRDGELRRLGAGGRALQALRLHARAGRRDAARTVVKRVKES